MGIKTNDIIKKYYKVTREKKKKKKNVLKEINERIPTRHPLFKRRVKVDSFRIKREIRTSYKDG